MSNATEVEPITAERRMTLEEAEAVLTLVRGGWLRLELNLNGARPA